MSEIPLYDVPAAFAELNRYRATAGQDPVAHQMVAIADKLAAHMARHFPDPADAATAGHAVVITAASLTGLVLWWGDRQEALPGEAMVNIAGLAGQRLANGVAGFGQQAEGGS